MGNRFLLALTALTLLSASSGSAEQAGEPKQGRPSLPLRPKAAANPCAEYGPGFVRMEGSSTCIRIGGNVGVGIGVSR